MIEVAQTTGMPAWALARFEASATANAPPERQHGRGRVRDFLVPIGVLIGSFLGFLLYTGNGDLIAGSGSASVLYAVLLAIAVAAAQLLLRGGRYYLRELNGTSFRGMGKLLPVVSIMLLALALGTSMQTLGAGPFMAGMISASLPAWLIVPVIFITAGIISFRTDTSWGRFGILVPVAMPIALAMDLSPALLRAAVLGGGTFGDHCSPISDSTVLASLAAGRDHLDHVRTQLPYVLFTAAITLPVLVLLNRSSPCRQGAVSVL